MGGRFEAWEITSLAKNNNEAPHQNKRPSIGRGLIILCEVGGKE